MNGVNSPATPPREARRARATSHSVPLRFNSISILTGSKLLPNTICFSSAVYERRRVFIHRGLNVMRTGLVEQKSKEKIIGHWQCIEECLKTRPLSGPYDWLKKGLGVFFTPTVFNLSVHSLLQFNHSSHCQESPHHPPPPSPCGAQRILCIHAAAHSTHRLKVCLRHDLQFVSGLERCLSCCKQHWLPTAITPAMGFFMVRVFFMGETPPTSGTHLELFNESLSLSDSLL